MHCNATRSLVIAYRLSVCPMWRWWIIHEQSGTGRTNAQIVKLCSRVLVGSYRKNKDRRGKSRLRNQRHETYYDMSRDRPDHPRCCSATCRCVCKHALTHFIFSSIIRNNHDAYRKVCITNLHVCIHVHSHCQYFNFLLSAICLTYCFTLVLFIVCFNHLVFKLAKK